MMKEEAYQLCKAKYEEVYGIPLTYGESDEKDAGGAQEETTGEEQNV